MIRMLFVVLLLCSTPVLAAEQIKVDAEKLAPIAGTKTKPGDKPSKPVKEDPDTKPITPEEQAALLCQTTQVMGSTAGADYVPGVDAYGHAVAPADANAGAQFSVPERIDIPLNVDVLNTVGVINQPTPSLSTNMGTISVLKGGQVLYNNQDMTTTVQGYCNTHTPVAATPKEEAK